MEGRGTIIKRGRRLRRKWKGKGIAVEMLVEPSQDKTEKQMQK